MVTPSGGGDITLPGQAGWPRALPHTNSPIEYVGLFDDDVIDIVIGLIDPLVVVVIDAVDDVANTGESLFVCLFFFCQLFFF